MTDDATSMPKKAGRPARGPKYPAAIPRIMTTRVQRHEIEKIADEEEKSLGEVVRELIEIGLDDRLRRNQPD